MIDRARYLAPEDGNGAAAGGVSPEAPKLAAMVKAPEPPPLPADAGPAPAPAVPEAPKRSAADVVASIRERLAARAPAAPAPTEPAKPAKASEFDMLSAALADVTAKIAGLETQVTKQRAAKLDAMLSDVDPAAHAFARHSLAGVDPFDPAGEAAVDAWKRANTKHLLPSAPVKGAASDPTPAAKNGSKLVRMFGGGR